MGRHQSMYQPLRQSLHQPLHQSDVRDLVMALAISSEIAALGCGNPDSLFEPTSQRYAALQRTSLEGGCVLIHLPARREWEASDGGTGTDWAWPVARRSRNGDTP